MGEPIISVSGLRGIVGESLNPEIAIHYTAAFAATLPPGEIVITRDGRASGEILAAAIHAGLNAVGRGTIDAGVAATPTLGVLVRQAQAAGGIQISASHNPVEYNGLKLFSADGRVLPDAPGRKVLQRYRAGTVDWAPQHRLGHRRDCPDALSAHLSAVINTVDYRRIRESRFRVFLDANHGAGSVLGRRLLAELHCEVVIWGDTPDGHFDHLPEPTADNLAGILVEVPRSHAQIGFCQDPDADRLAVIDESGRYLGEEYTVAMIVDHILRRRKGPVVVNCATSRMTEDLANKYNQPLFRSAVGEPNVVDLMLAKDAIFGGEGNGGPIDPRVGLVRDSFVGMAQLLDAMAARQMRVSELGAELPRYEMVKTKLALPQAKVAAALDALERRFRDARADRLDGLRLDWRDGRWLLVRPSNTEPVVRVIVEASQLEDARQLAADAAAVLAEIASAS